MTVSPTPSRPLQFASALSWIALTLTAISAAAACLFPLLLRTESWPRSYILLVLGLGSLCLPSLLGTLERIGVVRWTSLRLLVMNLLLVGIILFVGNT